MGSRATETDPEHEGRGAEVGPALETLKMDVRGYLDQVGADASSERAALVESFRSAVSSVEEGLRAAGDLAPDPKVRNDFVDLATAMRRALFGTLETAGGSSKAWSPTADILDRDDAYLVSVEIPGVGVDDLEIVFEHGVLTIQGERHVPHDAFDEGTYRVEGSYGAFRRSIKLPTHVIGDAIEASAQDGILRILVPKAKDVPAKRIPMRGGGASAVSTSSEQGKLST